MNLEEASKTVVERYGLHRWFASRTPATRDYARDALAYIKSWCRADRTRILETGCGIGQNLAHLWAAGFQDLWGVERDFDTYRGCVDVIDIMGIRATLACGDAQLVTFRSMFDVVLPWNWTYGADVDMPLVMAGAAQQLYPGGLLIIDIIDPEMIEPDRAPEYVHRYGEREFRSLCYAFGYRVIKVKDYEPRRMYYLERIERR